MTSPQVTIRPHAARTFDGQRRDQRFPGALAAVAAAGSIVLAGDSRAYDEPDGSATTTRRFITIPGVGAVLGVVAHTKVVRRLMKDIETVRSPKAVPAQVALLLAAAHTATVTELQRPLQTGAMLAIGDPPRLYVFNHAMAFSPKDRTDEPGGDLLGPYPNAAWLLERCYRPQMTVDQALRLAAAVVLGTAAVSDSVDDRLQIAVVDGTTQQIFEPGSHKVAELHTQVDAAFGPFDMLVA